MSSLLKWLRVGGILFGLAILAFALFWWSLALPPSAYHKVDRLREGMTLDEVIEIIGQPDSVFDNAKELAYSRPLSWGILYVYFDEQRHFVRWRYDE